MIQTFFWCSATSRWKNFDLNSSQFFRGNDIDNENCTADSALNALLEVTIVFDGFFLWFRGPPTIVFDGFWFPQPSCTMVVHGCSPLHNVHFDIWHIYYDLNM